MYLPRAHRLDDRDRILGLIEANPLGAWVCHADTGLVANHVPFLLDRTRGPGGTLYAHVSRANDVWRQLGPAMPSVVMFQGAQGYITPGWYPGKGTHGEVVPTWNYVVAHVHGTARVVDDHARLLDLLSRLTDTHEAAQTRPWRVADAPAAYIDRLLRGIVGIEIAIERLEGKLKLSQDEALEDRLGTFLGLRACPAAWAVAMADLVEGTIADGPAGAIPSP